MSAKFQPDVIANKDVIFFFFHPSSQTAEFYPLGLSNSVVKQPTQGLAYPVNVLQGSWFKLFQTLPPGTTGSVPPACH